MPMAATMISTSILYSVYTRQKARQVIGEACYYTTYNVNSNGIYTGSGSTLGKKSGGSTSECLR